jgi:Tfp pilus assembly protein PilF
MKKESSKAGKKPSRPPARTPRDGASGRQPDPDPVARFEEGVRTMHAGDYAAAKRVFDELAETAPREVAHAARLHARMCESRLAKKKPEPVSPEDRYNLGIALINSRRLAEAEAELRAALEIAPEGDHLHYALALCRGLSGDLTGAHRHLRRAIELQPRNRVLARNDPDFAEIASRPPLIDLLKERASSA